MGWGLEVTYKRTCTKGIFSHRRKSERALPVQKTTHKQGKGKNDKGWGRERRLRTHVNLRDPHGRAKAAANVKSDTWGDLQRQTSTIAPPLSLSPEGVECEQKNNNSRENGETYAERLQGREKCFALALLARYLPYAVCRFLGSLSFVPFVLLGHVLLSRLVERHRHHVHRLIRCGKSRLRRRMGQLRYNVALVVEALHHHVWLAHSWRSL